MLSSCRGQDPERTNGPSDFQTADINSLYHESAAGDSYGFTVEPCAILLFVFGIGMKAAKRRQWTSAFSIWMASSKCGEDALDLRK
jgi:hypothetical protein